MPQAARPAPILELETAPHRYYPSFSQTVLSRLAPPVQIDPKLKVLIDRVPDFERERSARIQKAAWLERKQHLAGEAWATLQGLGKISDPDEYFEKVLKPQGFTREEWDHALAEEKAKGFKTVIEEIKDARVDTNTATGCILGTLQRRRWEREHAAKPLARPVRRAPAATRTAPRRLGVRRHRRAATALQTTGTDDSSGSADPPPPPAASPEVLPLEAALSDAAAIALCFIALFAGYLVGAGAATLIPLGGLALAGRLLDVREAADKLRCSTSMVRKLARLGKIDVVQVGRLPRFTEEALARYVERATRRASAPLAAVRGGRRP